MHALSLNLLTDYSAHYPVVLMDREKVDTFKYVHEMNLLLRKGGLLLVTGSRARQ